jgi:hypothetical protein
LARQIGLALVADGDIGGGEAGEALGGFGKAFCGGGGGDFARLSFFGDDDLEQPPGGGGAVARGVFGKGLGDLGVGDLDAVGDGLLVDFGPGKPRRSGTRKRSLLVS